MRSARAVPLAVALIVLANVAIFVQELHAVDIDGFIESFATIPYNITHGIALAPPSPGVPALTVLTAMFVHGSVVHIAFNMLFLAFFGPDVERVCGHLGFAVLYLLCGIAGGIAQIASGPGSHVPELGASGAIAGVLGAYIVSFPLRLFPALFIAIWAGSQFVHGFGALSQRMTIDGGGTAYFAHIGGFACGVIAIGLFRRFAGTAASNVD